MEERWKETVRAIYDELHFGTDNIFNSNLADHIVRMIEERHSAYFSEAHACPANGLNTAEGARQYYAAHAPITLADALGQYSETDRPTNEAVMRRLARMRWHYADAMIAMES